MTAIGISWVDWKAVRREGWDGVVVDKDNCLVSCVRSTTEANRPARPEGAKVRRAGRNGFSRPS